MPAPPRLLKSPQAQDRACARVLDDVVAPEATQGERSDPRFRRSPSRASNPPESLAIRNMPDPPPRICAEQRRLRPSGRSSWLQCGRGGVCSLPEASPLANTLSNSSAARCSEVAASWYLPCAAWCATQNRKPRRRTIASLAGRPRSAISTGAARRAPRRRTGRGRHRRLRCQRLGHRPQGRLGRGPLPQGPTPCAASPRAASKSRLRT